MLRFIKHNLTSIDGVEFYPMLSLIIFVLFFAIIVTRVIRMSRAEITELGEIPLKENDEI